MNPTTILASLLAAAACGLGAYVQGRTDGRAAEVAARSKEDRVAAHAAEVAASAAAEAISKIEVKHVVNRQVLETQVREVPVFRDCRAPADSVQRLNAALTGAEPASAAGGVPTAPAAGR